METRRTPQAAIEAAIAIFGSEAKLGLKIGFSQVAINKARHGGFISDKMAKRIHWVTKGAVPGSETRPDLWTEPGHVPRRPRGWSPPLVPSLNPERARERQAP